MADATIKRNDTWPPIRGAASDQSGLLDLTTADSLKFLAKSGATLISGTAEALSPPEVDFDGKEYNWRYVWADGDTAIAGDYEVELEITWDSTTTPPQVETVPNSGKQTLTIESDVG